MLLSGNAAFAWNCSDPLASRVDVGTTQPSGSSGNGDGQWFKGTGSEGTTGHYYVCQVPKPPKKGGKSGDPTSTSSSSSSSNATGGNSSSTATGGNATGGNSSSKSGVSTSGNSSNTNNNNANGGQGGAGGQGGKGGTGIGVGIGGGATNNGNGNGNGNGSNNTTTANGGSANGNGSNNSTSASSNQSQTQSNSSSNTNSSAASNNGNGSNDTTTITNVAAPKIPVSTAYAPTNLPTSPCTKGFGAGVQTMAVGGSFGMSNVDKNCVILEAARNAPNILTFCKVYITHKAVKAAGVTLDDCMKSYAIPEPVVQIKEVIKEVPVTVVKEVPVEVIKEVPAPLPPFQNQLVGICTFASQFSCDLKTKGPGNPLRVTTICDDMLRQAIALQRSHPGTVIKLIGNENASEMLSNSMYALARAKNVQRRLVVLGATPGSIAVETGKTGDRTVEVWVIAQ
jgi:hypothetical protein